MYNHIGTREGIKFYKSETKNPVSDKEFRDISNKFNVFILDKVIDGEIVKLPERIGTLRVTGRKLKPRINKETGNVEGLSPDWKSTRELWKKCPECRINKQLVFHFNEQTDGLRYSFKWSKTGVFINNRDFYSLKMARSAKDKFKTVLKAGKEYINE
jgi:hypothetical protein